jgi:glycosyltransferase involved in cell wall biosynthesis
MRITLLSHFPGKGGSNTLLVQLSEYLRDLNHEITVVVGADCADPILGEYVVVRGITGKGWKRRMAAYVEAIQATRPDVIYSFSGKDELDVFRFLNCVRIRHVFSMEHHEFTDMPFWIRKVGRFTEAFTASTPDVLARIQSLTLGTPRNSFAGWIVPYRVNETFKAVSPPSADPSANAGVVNVCFVGRLDPFQKRAHWLPEIIERCRSAGRNIRWHIYGQGPLESEIKAQVREKNLTEQVCFHGWANVATLAAQLPLLDLFFLCSRWEGLPAAMVEAMLCGLACVVPADPGGMTYALSQGGGWTYEARSPAAGADALIAATADTKILLKKRLEAQSIARKLFAGRVAEEQLAAFAAGFPKLKSNGNRLEIDRAPRMRSVPALVALKRRLLAALRVGPRGVSP